jgi:CDP-diacylglycerol--serine O-phosphatidyltransferase
MRITRAVVPSLFTVLNMFSGFMCIVHASRNEFISAAWFIVLAAGFDAFDGIMARITKSSSAFGVQIDSLSDVVSFGAAPAFLVYQIHLQSLGGLGIFLSSLLMVFGGLRLARFNVQLVGFEKDHFVGLPIPVSALTIASFVMVFTMPGGRLSSGAAAALPWMVPVLGLLMVSRIRYETLPRLSKKAVKREPWKFVFALLSVVLIIATGGDALFPVFLLFIVLGIIRTLILWVRRVGKRAEPFEAEEDEDEEEEAIESHSN